MKINQLNVWNRFFSKNEQLALAGLVLVGIVLRVINALQTQLWRDEAYLPDKTIHSLTFFFRIIGTNYTLRFISYLFIFGRC